mmetsp:Transcript_101624/g.296267  ORF Transcript_101624/g.296267 Transcript_101624/m.296267 type:complete len:318 (+) Transcript_101624:1532-2485(+)
MTLQFKQISGHAPQASMSVLCALNLALDVGSGAEQIKEEPGGVPEQAERHGNKSCGLYNALVLKLSDNFSHIEVHQLNLPRKVLTLPKSDEAHNERRIQVELPGLWDASNWAVVDRGSVRSKAEDCVHDFLHHGLQEAQAGNRETLCKALDDLHYVDPEYFRISCCCGQLRWQLDVCCDGPGLEPHQPALLIQSKLSVDGMAIKLLQGHELCRDRSDFLVREGPLRSVPRLLAHTAVPAQPNRSLLLPKLFLDHGLLLLVHQEIVWGALAADHRFAQAEVGGDSGPIVTIADRVQGKGHTCHTRRDLPLHDCSDLWC